MAKLVVMIPRRRSWRIAENREVMLALRLLWSPCADSSSVGKQGSKKVGAFSFPVTGTKSNFVLPGRIAWVEANWPRRRFSLPSDPSALIYPSQLPMDYLDCKKHKTSCNIFSSQTQSLSALKLAWVRAEVYHREVRIKTMLEMLR